MGYSFLGFIAHNLSEESIYTSHTSLTGESDYGVNVAAGIFHPFATIEQ